MRAHGERCAFHDVGCLKHGGAWDFLAQMFGQKTSAFECMIVRFIHMLSETVYEQYVVYQTKRWSMKMLHDNKRVVACLKTMQWQDTRLMSRFSHRFGLQEAKRKGKIF